MSTDMMWQTKSDSSESTERLAERLGRALRGGEVVELVSDLGGGKTTFVRGLARGAGSRDVVSSPTFTISKVYACQAFDIHHFDFYRLQEAGIVGAELHDLLGDPKIVTVVEWPEIVKDALPEDRLRINIKRLSQAERQLTFMYPEAFIPLIEAVK